MATIPTKDTVSGDETVRQDNHITLDKPSGSMTIIINNRSAETSTPASSTGHFPSCNTPEDNVSATLPSDISIGAQHPPVQPRVRYPSSFAGTKRRSFNSDWFDKYRWLEYSQDRDSAYCYACRIFAISAKKSDAFTHAGFRDWKHATGQNGSLAKHDSSHTHKQAMLSWAEYVKNSDRNTTIGDRLDSRRQQIQDNRSYLKTIAEIILLCARQDSEDTEKLPNHLIGAIFWRSWNLLQKWTKKCISKHTKLSNKHTW